MAEKDKELLDNIDADLGLVWDGNYDESDEAEGVKYKEYTNTLECNCNITRME